MSRREDLDAVAAVLKYVRTEERTLVKYDRHEIIDAMRKLAEFAQNHLDALDAKRFLGYTGSEYTKPTAAELDLRDALSAWPRGLRLATAARQLEDAARAADTRTPVSPPPVVTELQRAAIIYTHALLAGAPQPAHEDTNRGYHIALTHLQRIIAP